MGNQKRKYTKKLISAVLSASLVMTGLVVPSKDADAAGQKPWLLSEGRPAYASTVNGGDKALFATDGRQTTSWGAVETKGTTLEENQKDLDQWLDVDLGAAADISSVEINWQGAWVYATSYDLLVSDDEENWTKVYEQSNGTGGDVYHVYEVGERKTPIEYQVKKSGDKWVAVNEEDQAALDDYAKNGQGKAYEIYRETADLSGKTANGRYLRIQTHGSWSQSENNERKGFGVAIRELKVYGVGGVVKPSVSAVNIAPNHPTSASTEVVDWDHLRESAGAFDGDDGTYWKSKEGNDEWVQVDLEKVYKIGRMTIEWVAEFGRVYDLQTSLDGENWTTVYRQLHGIGEKEEIHMYQDARYVRMKGYAMGRGSGYTVKELQIFEYQEGDPKENPLVEDLPEKRVVEVGEGSYVIDNVNLRQPREPYYATENLKTPIVSNDWWSSVLYQRLSDAIATLPYALQYTDTGLGFYYVNEQYITQSSEWGASGAIGSGSEQNDLTLHTSEIKGTPSSKVDKYGDWSVDVVWSDDDTPKMKTTMVKGSPFLYNTFSNPQEVEISAYKIIRFFDKDNKEILANDGDSVTTDHIGVVTENVTKGAPELNNREDRKQEHSFGIYVPEGTRFTRIGSKIKVQLGNNENYMTVGVLEKNIELNYLYQYAYNYVTDTIVDYIYDEASGMVTTNYRCVVEPKRTGAEFKNETLMCLFQHQWRNTDSAVEEDKTYSSIRGTLKVHEGNTFDYRLRFTGIIPAFSNPGKDVEGYDEELMREYLKMFKESTISNYWIADPYWQGKKTHPMAMGIMIAEQLGDYETRDLLLKNLKKVLVNWLSYDGEDDWPYHMYYSESWGALNGNGGDFGMAMNLTDHHFVWAYFIYPAAVLASYDPSFVEDYGEMLEMLIRDCMNPDKDDELFPFMRNFDPYEGHSWAGGYCDNPDGNNQESAGEATFAWAGLYLWGLVTGNDAYRDAGIWGWTSESNAIMEYWFDVHDDIWLPAYNEGCVGMVFGLSYNNGTYFGVNPSSIYGIHLLPVTPAQSYMGYNQEYAAHIYAKYREAQDRYQNWLTTNNKQEDPEGWYHIMLPFLSLTDAGQAVKVWDEQWSQVDEAGQHTSNLAKERDELYSSYWYLQNMNAKGQFTDEIWSSNYTSYQVFKKDGTYTATVWNPKSEPIRVEFRNAQGVTATVVVAANSLVDVDPTKSGTYGEEAPPADFYEDVYGVPGVIRAADYHSNFNCSLTNDTEEGSVVGAIKNNASLVYKVDVEEAGDYVIEYNIKSVRETTGGTIRTKSSLSDETLSTLSFVNEGDWKKETWSVLRGELTLEAGKQDLLMYFSKGQEDFDEIFLSWIKIYKKGTTPPTVGEEEKGDMTGMPKISLADAKVTASSEINEGSAASKATDGDPGTRWESEAQDPQTLTIELKETTQIGGFSIKWEAAAAKVYTIDVSEDGQNWETAFAKTDGKGGDNFSIKFDTVHSAKYVRMHGTERVGGYGYSIYELELYGKGDDQRIQLAAPVVTAAKKGENAAQLSWNAVANVREYQVYRALSTKAAKKLIKTTTEVSYTDENLTEGTYYYWVVAAPGENDAVYGASKYSADIAGVSISAKAAALETTTVTAQKSGENQIKLDWEAVAGAASYEVYRTTGILPKRRIATVTETSYTDGSLSAGTYQYRIVAVPAENSGLARSDYSEATSSVQITEKLAAPAVKAVLSGKDAVKLSWDEVENAHSYRVYRSNSATGEKAALTTVYTAGYTDMALTDGTYYYWAVAVPSSKNYEPSDYSADIGGVTVSGSGNAQVEAESIALNKTELKMEVGQKEKLTAVIAPDNATDKTVVWISGNDTIVTAEDGVITAVGAGIATITAKTGNNKTAECKVTVTLPETPGDSDKEVSSVTLSASKAELAVGEELTLTASILPEDAKDKSITWRSSNDAVATVKDGVVKAVAPGTVNITASASNGKTAKCVVAVKENGSGGPDEAEADSVTLNRNEIELTVDEEFTLTASVLPENAKDKTITWSSSDNTKATVKDGVVKAVGEGTAFITASTSNGKTAKCTVTVKAKTTTGDKIEVESVTISQSEAELIVGDTLALTASVLPEDATDKTIIWSTSDDKVATVSGGTVTAVSDGTAVITASSANEKTAECTVTVKKQKEKEVESVAFETMAKEMTVGEEFTLNATVLPEDAEDKTLTWSSSKENVATVDEGKVRAISEGTTTITAEAKNGKKAECLITVGPESSDPKVERVEISRQTAELEIGDTLELSAKAVPEDAAGKTLYWKSSDEEITSVVRTGDETDVPSVAQVQAIGAGTATITVFAANGVKAECIVTVKGNAPEVESVTLNTNAAKLKVGGTLKLTAEVLPKDAEDKALAWSSSKESVATVNGGEVLAVGVGTTTITAAAANGKKAECVVEVEAASSTEGEYPQVIKVTSIRLEESVHKVAKGASIQLRVTVLPANAQNKNVTWETSDPAVASVDANGTVTAKNYGVATIKATAADGSNVSAACQVRVGYKITYKLKKGKNNEANPSTYYKEVVKLKKPARKGYLFKGWYTDKKYKKKITKIKSNAARDYTLYAKWEKVKVDKTAITDLSSPKKGTIRAEAKKVKKAAGYEVTVAKDKKLKKGKKVVSGKKAVQTVKVKAGTYYVRIRAYKKDSTGKKVYGKTESVEQITVQ